MCKEIDGCRAEEEHLKDIREAVLKAFIDFSASLVAQPDMDMSLRQDGASAGATGYFIPPSLSGISLTPFSTACRTGSQPMSNCCCLERFQSGSHRSS
jgi:hypothetical protein